MLFTQLDLIFIQSFDYYLRVEKRMQHNTVVGTIANLRKIVRLTVNKGIIPIPVPSAWRTSSVFCICLCISKAR